MTKHPTSRRGAHHGVADSDDVFVTRMIELSAWAKAHTRTLVIGAIVLAIAIIGTWQYVEYRQAMTQRAGVELLEIRGTAASGNYPLASRDLEAFLERFGDTPSAPEARILLGQLYLAQNQPQQAIDALLPVQGEGDHLVTAAAGLLLAGAYEMANQLPEAERTYLEVAEQATLDYHRREALEDAARVRAQSGDTAGAIQLYDRLIALVEQGPERDVYEMRRAELEASRS